MKHRTFALVAAVAMASVLLVAFQVVRGGIPTAHASPCVNFIHPVVEDTGWFSDSPAYPVNRRVMIQVYEDSSTHQYCGKIHAIEEDQFTNSSPAQCEQLETWIDGSGSSISATSLLQPTCGYTNTCTETPSVSGQTATTCSTDQSAGWYIDYTDCPSPLGTGTGFYAVGEIQAGLDTTTSTYNC